MAVEHVWLDEHQDKTWVTDAKLWRVGFHITSLNAISWLSGITQVLDIHWLEHQDALVFVVKNCDRSDILFKKGYLKAAMVENYKPTNQSILVHRTKNDLIFIGGGN